MPLLGLLGTAGSSRSEHAAHVQQPAPSPYSTLDLLYRPAAAQLVHAAFEFACATNAAPHPPRQDDPSGIFDTDQRPSCSLFTLGVTLLHHLGMSDAMHLVRTIVLCSRYCLSVAVAPTVRMMHRLYVACLLVVIKAHHHHHDDAGVACEVLHSHYAIVAGIRPAALNRLEAEVLRGTGWSVQVTVEQLQLVVDRMLASPSLGLRKLMKDDIQG